MEGTSQVPLTEPAVERVAEQPSACAYVLVIPRVEGPVMETLEKLIAARDSRVTAPSAPVLAQYREAETSLVFEAVEALRNRYIPPSTQALRSWRAAAIS